MKVPISWLNEYVDLSDLSVAELSDLLTFSGIEVEGIETIGAALDDNFVVAEVVACEKHANSDHLSVCQVNDGNKTWQVVCGAPNAHAGLKVAFAKIGAVIPEGEFTIKKAKLRGVESFGMLCSARELKLSDEHDGIMELETPLPIGSPLRDALPTPEVVLDLEITWNRPDCLSIIGVAREFAALLNRPLNLPDTTFTESSLSATDFAKVTIIEPWMCPRYTARIMTDVEDGAAPAWMRRRLELAGVRSMSLIVDVTNYVMLECGQPLHAFDYRKLAKQSIVVRRAQTGEKLRTLDGVERNLTNDMLVIADALHPTAVAGVMGGAESEIEPGTQHILLESALFDAPTTKNSALKLGLSSESSRRFERGVDPDLADWASRRATALLARLGKAEVAAGAIDVDFRKFQRHTVTMRFARAQELIGVAIAPQIMLKILTALGLEVQTRSDDAATLIIPSWRIDLQIEADLIEEVARVYGLDAIPDRMPDATHVSILDDTPFYARAKLRQCLLGMGFSEAMHYSFLADTELDAFGKEHRERRAQLPNPVSADYGVLRDSLLPQLANSLGHNAAHQVESAALFEMGRVFQLDANGQPCEEEHLALGISGPFWRPTLDRRRPVTKDEAILALKGVLTALFNASFITKATFKAVEHPAFETGWAFEILFDERVVGRLGLLNAKLRHQWRMTTPLPLAEVELAPLLLSPPRQQAITPPPAYPAVRRDLAIVADNTITHQQVVAAARQATSTDLTNITLFDIFTSKEIGKGKRSLAYTFEFRSSERTLTDLEVNSSFANIIQTLKESLKVEIRES